MATNPTGRIMLEASTGMHGEIPEIIAKEWAALASTLETTVRRLEALERSAAEPSFAGVKIWIGDKQVTQLVSKAEIEHEPTDGASITDAAQTCLNLLAGKGVA